jgi:hypothetical protein
MRIINSLLHYLLTLGLCLSCATALAVPKAAEHEDGEVTFGDAGAPPKPAAKHAAPAVAKTPKAPAVQTPASAATTKGGRAVRPTTDKRSKHAAQQGSRATTGKAGKQAAGSKQAAASKPATARPASTNTARAAKPAPATKAPEKAKRTTKKN